MSIGIPYVSVKTTDTVITSSAALVTVGLTSPIAVNQKQSFRAWIPIEVGATGGVRAQVVVPAAGTAFISSFQLFNTVAPASPIAIQTASAAFTNALANAGTHWLLIEGTVENGANAGNIDIQLAQNTSDPLSLTVKTGAKLEIVVL